MRKYRPEIGRWLSRDPIEENGGANLYAFTFNNSFQAYDNRGNIPVKYQTRKNGTIVSVEAVTDITPEEGGAGNQWGGFAPLASPVEGACEVTVLLQILLSPSLAKNSTDGVTYYYKPHYISSSGNIAGGHSYTSDNRFKPLRDEVLAHEYGHAWAFLLFTKQVFDAYVADIKAPLSAADVQKIDLAFAKSRNLTLQHNVDYANSATVNWYRSNGFHERKDSTVYKFYK